MNFKTKSIKIPSRKKASLNTGKSSYEASISADNFILNPDIQKYTQ